VAGPGLGARVGFRLMAWVMSFTRRSQATDERVRSSGVHDGQTVLDYACGPGYFTVVAARLVGQGGVVYALDVQSAAAAMVADRARRASLDNITTIVSGRDTGLPDGVVDVVLLYDAIQVIQDRHGVLAELDRVLKPGGILSLWVEHGAPEDAVALVADNSRFVLHERHGDILNFIRD
jgi:ubiquinone/menaquinone biosynthesis C-methylase UbiE